MEIDCISKEILSPGRLLWQKHPYRLNGYDWYSVFTAETLVVSQLVPEES